MSVYHEIRVLCWMYLLMKQCDLRLDTVLTIIRQIEEFSVVSIGEVLQLLEGWIIKIHNVAYSVKYLTKRSAVFLSLDAWH